MLKYMLQKINLKCLMCITIAPGKIKGGFPPVIIKFIDPELSSKQLRHLLALILIESG